MTTRREAILKEMGLTPLWKSRGVTPGRPGTGGPDESSVPPVPPGDFVEDDRPAAMTPSIAREARIAKMDWPALKAAVPACTACVLHKSRTQTVFGVGDEMADWLLVAKRRGPRKTSRASPSSGRRGGCST